MKPSSIKKFVLVFALATTALTVVAETPEEKGLAISQEADKRDNGWGDFEAEMAMVLRNKQGDESVRNVRIRNMEVPGDGDKGLSIFDKPRDVKGTAVLTWSHSLDPDDQWIFLPALKRVKRISSKNKFASHERAGVIFR